MAVRIARPIQRISVFNDASSHTLSLVPTGQKVIVRVTNGKRGRPLDVAILSRAEVADLRDALIELLGAS